MDNYDLNSAKRTLSSLIIQTRDERPYVMFNQTKMMDAILTTFVEYTHKARVEVAFDTETLAYLHLFEKTVLESVLMSVVRSHALEALVKKKGSPLQVRFTTTRCKRGEKIARENLHNVDIYETLVRDKSAFYLCSFIDMATSTTVFSHVVKEGNQLTSLKASYALYSESLATFNERMDRFIDEENLNEDMGVEFLAKRKKEIGQWLRNRYKDDGQFIQFEDQEAYSETAYTMRQLLTSIGDTNCLLDLMISKTLLSNKPASGKKTRLIIACMEYKCNAPYLVDFCRRSPELVRNRHDYNETLKKSPSGPIDTATVKDENDALLSMSILDRPEFIKILAKRDATKLLSYETNELLDDTRRITSRGDKITLDEQCKDILLPYINKEVRHFFGPEYGELDVCQEIIDVCLKRIDQLATREKGLDGASRAIKGCIMYLMTKAMEVLEERRATEEKKKLFDGSLTLKKSKIPIEAFDEKNQTDWSFTMRELMQDNENRKELGHHQRQKTSITVLNIMMGKDLIFSSILPCANSSYSTYVTNNNIVVYNFDNKESKKKLRDYNASMIEILKEEDLAIMKEMIVKLVENDGMPQRQKRKRVTPQAAEDTPLLTKRLKTKNEMELFDMDEEDGTDTRPIVVIKGERVPKQEPKGSRVCECCDMPKPLCSFYNESKSYAYLRNVCHTCLTRKKKLDKAQK